MMMLSELLSLIVSKMADAVIEANQGEEAAPAVAGRSS